ncbi:hypothetical protein JTE90_019666 [Oedothorax gibbosus]|uniref:Uncharacterized protein n=1 Tax=Oedothorax gibbosus TaxID=931172 RepID=A0AAV6TG15_9ARAC|nr:hypothetical protein JTE90_019666 [Oedothorax gibbosus]
MPVCSSNITRVRKPNKIEPARSYAIIPCTIVSVTSCLKHSFMLQSNLPVNRDNREAHKGKNGLACQKRAVTAVGTDRPELETEIQLLQLFNRQKKIQKTFKYATWSKLLPRLLANLALPPN